MIHKSMLNSGLQHFFPKMDNYNDWNLEDQDKIQKNQQESLGPWKHIINKFKKNHSSVYHSSKEKE